MQTTSSFGSSAANGKSNDAHSNSSQSKSDFSSGIAQEFQKFVNDIEELLKATTNLTGEELQRAKAKLNQRISTAKELATEMSESVITRARKTAATTNAYVHEQPWAAIGASAAAGVLVGYLLSRRQ